MAWTCKDTAKLRDRHDGEADEKVAGLNHTLNSPSIPQEEMMKKGQKAAGLGLSLLPSFPFGDESQFPQKCYLVRKIPAPG